LEQRDKSGRTIFLKNIPYEEARAVFQNAIGTKIMPEEILPVHESLGRVTSKPVIARISSPHFHAAAMDGIAVDASKTFGARETSPIKLREQRDAYWVDTGDPIPPATNAVIMVEELNQVGDEFEIISPVSPWENVRIYGEDLVETEMIIPGNTKLRPVDLGSILAGGVREISVRKKPVVGIIPTGTELVPIGKDPAPGEIIEFNSTIFASMVEEWGADPTVFPIVPDDYDVIKTTVEKAVSQCDVVLIGAGSSHGSEDFTSKVIAELGEVLVHGIATRPGKPVVLGHIKETPVIGVPGYPVSACLIMDLFVRPLILNLLGLPIPEPNCVEAVLSRDIVSSMGVDEFVRVRLGKVGDRLVATPIGRGAALTTSLVRADGTVVVPKNREGLSGGSHVSVSLLRSTQEILGQVVAIGSHDVLLDVIASLLREMNPSMTLSSANQGSLGGILAIKRGEAHLAGTHLLDENTGRYNIDYVEKYLQEVPAKLITLVYRQQGFMVKPGNPKAIREIEDLLRPDVSFVNRQKGSGTRVLLDYALKAKGIDSSKISGYEHEEYTHTQVAASVKSGTADVGLGILSAARALGLEFIPWKEERYDLLIPKIYFDHPGVQAILQLIKEKKFHDRVMELGGYDLRDTGKLQWESGE
jgi:putative molybdopterin biosynthesis protein